VVLVSGLSDWTGSITPHNLVVLNLTPC